MTAPPPRIEQLKRAHAAGLIDQDTYDAAVAALAAPTGSCAIAQGPEALAVGAGGVAVQGDNTGTINLGLLIQQGTQPGASPATLTRAYLARILTQANQLPLFVGDGANAQVRLSAVYTALLIQGGSVEAAPDGGRSLERPDRHPSALDALNTASRLVLLGGPGSGKSTFVNFVALSLAGELLKVPGPNLETLTAPLPNEDGDDKAQAPQRWDHGPLLPVPVVLRDLASQLPPPGIPVNAETLWRFLQGRLKQAALEDFAPVLKQRLLDQGGLILLDGLDEVPDAHERRAQIKQAVQDFAASFSRCRFLVTSRTYAYQRQEWQLDGFTQTHLLPLRTGQIKGFVDAWYAHMVELLRLTPAAARDRAEVLIRTVERNERIRELAERPLLLTLIAQLQTYGSCAAARGSTIESSRAVPIASGINPATGTSTWRSVSCCVLPLFLQLRPLSL
ncbi:NACHT domain-containing NTPase [uncultured Thiodictyon sp.]|uniref:NACHT domain-containing protein n=1 Tax=uncultured Thiodictyon sp. TaxID=1846217 RepID=UPI0025D7010A|nr:NACHT domain-containing protein [uncultured Thiodictyon sp.]